MLMMNICEHETFVTPIRKRFRCLYQIWFCLLGMKQKNWLWNEKSNEHFKKKNVAFGSKYPQQNKNKWEESANWAVFVLERIKVHLTHSRTIKLLAETPTLQSYGWLNKDRQRDRQTDGQAATVFGCFIVCVCIRNNIEFHSEF